jgi:uncharacterized protein with PIN domain
MMMRTSSAQNPFSYSKEKSEELLKKILPRSDSLQNALNLAHYSRHSAMAIQYGRDTDHSSDLNHTDCNQTENKIEDLWQS